MRHLIRKNLQAVAEVNVHHGSILVMIQVRRRKVPHRAHTAGGETIQRLLRYGGHIGYAVRLGEWNKGYGTLMLSLALPYAKELILLREIDYE